jgi:hypothetical protein
MKRCPPIHGAVKCPTRNSEFRLAMNVLESPPFETFAELWRNVFEGTPIADSSSTLFAMTAPVFEFVE